MLSESDPYVFVDLDHVVSADGVVEVWAQAIIDKMRSYTELSQSEPAIQHDRPYAIACFRSPMGAD